MLNGCCLLAGIILGILLRFGSGVMHLYFLEHWREWSIYAGSVVVANYLVGGYGVQLKVSRFNLVVDWAFSVALALLVVSFTSYAWFQLSLGRGVLILAVAIYSVLWLGIVALLYDYLFRTDTFAYRVAIGGECAGADELKVIVTNDLIRPTHRVVAFLTLDGHAPVSGPRADGIPVLRCGPGELLETMRSLKIDALLFAKCSQDIIADLYPVLRRLRFESMAVLDTLSAIETYTGRIPLEMVNEQWLMQASARFLSPFIVRIKRIFDCVVSAALLAALAPVWLLIILATKASMPSAPVIYAQLRMGRFGRPFVMFKFRTMRPGADAAGAAWSPADDPRVTPVGRFLRRFRLDEIPQFINVLRGEMSLVGPRPEQPDIVTRLEQEIPFYRERENVLPGITGWAQIRHPYGATLEDARRKFEYDLFYINNMSPALDIRISLSTLRIVLFGLERKAP